MKLLNKLFYGLGKLSVNTPKPSIKPFIAMKDAFKDGRKVAKESKPTTVIHTNQGPVEL